MINVTFCGFDEFLLEFVVVIVTFTLRLLLYSDTLRKKKKTNLLWILKIEENGVKNLVADYAPVSRKLVN